MTRRPLEWLVITIGLVTTAIVAVYAFAPLMSAALWVATYGVVVLLAWAILGRVWDALRHGKPLSRSGGLLSRSGSSPRAGSSDRDSSLGELDHEFRTDQDKSLTDQIEERRQQKLRDGISMAKEDE